MEELYGWMKFELDFQLVLDHYDNGRSNDIATMKRSYKGRLSAFETPTLYIASMLLVAGSEHTRAEIMRIYCNSKTIDTATFVNDFWHFQSETPKTATAFIQPNTSNKRCKTMLPPSPCQYCRGNHLKNGCPDSANRPILNTKWWS